MRTDQVQDIFMRLEMVAQDLIQTASGDDAQRLKRSTRAFKSAYEGQIGSSEISAIEIDLGNVDYLDSAALGMLLLLRDQASGTHKTVILSNCHGVVQQILDIANFKKLFTIQ